MDIVAGRLKELRDSVGFSQAKVAELVGTTQASINRYEKGQSEPPLKTLLWYADTFDVSMDYIFGRTDQKQGTTYKAEPKVIEALTQTSNEVRQFVNMCFDPKSPMSNKLKEVLMEMLEEGRK